MKRVPITIERALICAVVRDAALAPLIDAGVGPGQFQDLDEAAVLEFMLKYLFQYGAVPTTARVEEEFPGYKVYPVADPLPDYLDRFRSHRKQSMVEDVIERVSEQMMAGQSIDDVVSDLIVGSVQIGQEAAVTFERNVPDSIDAVFNDCVNRRGGGLQGLSTSFPTIDRATRGLQPEQLITIVGPPKSGKSVLELVIASHVQRNGKRCLFVTIEMSSQEQIERYIAFNAHVDHHRLRSGHLTDREKGKVREYLKTAKALPEFIISSDVARAASVGKLEVVVQRYAPDVLFIDGVYLLQDEISKEYRTWRALSNLTTGFKHLAQRRKIPVIITTQTLESKMPKGKVSTASIGYSSSFAQDSDVVLGVEHVPNQTDQRTLKILASRHCALDEALLDWDWTNGNFREYDGDGSGDD